MPSTRWHHSEKFSVDEFEVDIFVVRIVSQFPDIIHVKQAFLNCHLSDRPIKLETLVYHMGA